MNKCIYTAGKKSYYAIFLLKIHFHLGSQKAEPQAKKICYYNVRQCNCKQIQVMQKKSKLSEERRVNLRVKAGYHLVLIVAFCLTSWISEAVRIMGFRAIFPMEWSKETLSSTFSIRLVQVYPRTALSYSIRAPALGPALYRVKQHLHPSLVAPSPTSCEVPWNLDLTTQKAHQECIPAVLDCTFSCSHLHYSTLHLLLLSHYNVTTCLYLRLRDYKLIEDRIISLISDLLVAYIVHGTY